MHYRSCPRRTHALHTWLLRACAVPTFYFGALMTGAIAEVLPKVEFEPEFEQSDGSLSLTVNEESALEWSAAATERRFFTAARNYADQMLARGRDVYGKETPLFASMLTRETYTLLDSPETNLPDMKPYGVRRHDRAWNGSNPMHDAQLYRLLYELTDITEESQYAQAADDSLQYFFENAQNPITGFLAWGEHMSWRLDADQPQADREMLHEMLPWPLWDRAYQIAPRQSYRFALGLWNHQMMNKATGDFSRHARYDTHAPRTGGSFPRYGANMITVWTHGYKSSSHPMFQQEMLTAIDTVLESYLQRIHPETGALPAGTGRYGNNYLLVNNLLMTCELATVADQLPPEMAAKIATLMEQTDATVFKLEHNLDGQIPGRPLGYVNRAYADTLEPGDPRKKTTNDYTTLWASGYGAPLTSWVTTLLLDRYNSTQDQRYLDLALQGADLYLTHEPDTSIALHPKSLARAIGAMLEAHKATGNEAYLQRAEFFGDRALELFFSDGSALPRVTTMHDHYETITGGDDLMLSLLNLDQALVAIAPQLDS